MSIPPLSPDDPHKAERAGSFGEVASHYERYRPGPPIAAVDWLLPSAVDTVIDLGAGTGALTRLLVGRAREVIAVEPDDRMRSVLAEEVPDAQVVKGWGESMPLADASADAVLASSSWHWMDSVPALHEVGRALRAGGTMGAVWSGPDPDGPFLVQAQALLSGGGGAGTGDGGTTGDAGGELAGILLGAAEQPSTNLEIPAGVPFGQPDHELFRWDVSLTADDLIGLLGTMSWIITMPAERRTRVVSEARRLLAEALGVEGDVTVDVAFRADAWRCRRND